MKNDREQFIDYFEGMFGIKANIFAFTPEETNPPLYILTFKELPEPGYTTAITFGVSLIPHPSNKNGQSELILSLRSEDDIWAMALGEIALKLRTSCPFSYGNTMRFGQIAANSRLSAFFVFAPSFLEKEEAEIALSSGKIFLKQLYPIYEGELDRIRMEGLKALFTDESIDFFDTLRPDSSQKNRKGFSG